MGKAVRLVVFDLDGTLVDSKVDLANSVNYALGAFGFPLLPYEMVYSYVGDGAATLIQRSLGTDGREILPLVLETFLTHYREHLLDTTVPFPGVSESLEAHSKAFEMAVLTNKPIDMTRNILAGLSLSRYFVDVRGGDSFDSKKPNPEGLLRIMKKRGTSPAESLMVGDSVNDVLAGQRAGVVTCGVSYGIGAKGFAEHSPDFTIDHFPELFHRIRPIR
ncbi:MAG: HAD-IA family hydrolase [Candidatus Deferrimicrobiaceae bacterium]